MGQREVHLRRGIMLVDLIRPDRRSHEAASARVRDGQPEAGCDPCQPSIEALLGEGVWPGERCWRCWWERVKRARAPREANARAACRRAGPEIDWRASP